MSITIGIPKEIMNNEHRVGATPETVKKMKQWGVNIIVERNAGAHSYHDDADYISAGADIENDAAQVYLKSDIILKVKEPLFNADIGKHEVDMMRKNQYLVAFLHPASPANHDMVKKLASNGIISFTLDSIPRISRAQQMDALTSMSTVAGYKGLLLATESLPKFVPMIATAAGVQQPAKVLIIGAGVAGLQALATAKRLGAVVLAADIRNEAVEQAKSLGVKIVELNIPQDLAVGTGGYAKTLPEDLIDQERNTLRPSVSEADIIILSALVPGKKAPVLITEDMVASMQPGSVIVDISVDQGGNCAITELGKKLVKHGVTVIGIANIPGMVPKSATGMFSLNSYNFLANIIKDGSVIIDMNDEITSSCLLTQNGEIIHKGTRETMGI